MSIVTEIKREYKKLSHEMESGQRRMKALEIMMREYKVWHYPYSEALSDIILQFLADNEGKASFDAIAYMLEERKIEIPHQKLSLILNRLSSIYYNRDEQKWEIKTAINEAS